MSDLSTVVAVYATHVEAQEAVKQLDRGGIDMRTLSIVGKGTHTDEQVVGYYNTGDRMKHWGKMGAFWGGLWGMLFGSAFFLIPGIGPLLVAGPLVAWIVGASGRRRCCRWIERGWRGTGQHRNSEGQRRSVRTGAQNRSVSSGSARYGCPRRESQRDHRDHTAHPVGSALE